MMHMNPLDIAAWALLSIRFILHIFRSIYKKQAAAIDNPKGPPSQKRSFQFCAYYPFAKLTHDENNVKNMR